MRIYESSFGVFNEGKLLNGKKMISDNQGTKTFYRDEVFYLKNEGTFDKEGNLHGKGRVTRFDNFSYTCSFNKGVPFGQVTAYDSGV